MPFTADPVVSSASRPATHEGKPQRRHSDTQAIVNRLKSIEPMRRRSVNDLRVTPTPSVQHQSCLSNGIFSRRDDLSLRFSALTSLLSVALYHSHRLPRDFDQAYSLFKCSLGVMLQDSETLRQKSLVSRLKAWFERIMVEQKPCPNLYLIKSYLGYLLKRIEKPVPNRLEHDFHMLVRIYSTPYSLNPKIVKDANKVQFLNRLMKHVIDHPGNSYGACLATVLNDPHFYKLKQLNSPPIWLYRFFEKDPLRKFMRDLVALDFAEPAQYADEKLKPSSLLMRKAI